LQIADCGFRNAESGMRILDCGSELGFFNPKSEIRNR
jgi:hypothetical protein